MAQPVVTLQLENQPVTLRLTGVKPTENPNREALRTDLLTRIQKSNSWKNRHFRSDKALPKFVQEVLSELERGNNLVLGHAQTLILAYSRNNAINAPVDTALALDYADLMLQAHGVGTCWAGYLTRFANTIPALQEMFPLPDNNSFYGALLVGWPKEDYLYIPQRLKRADIQFVK